jgi:hypothetical protein
MDVQEGKSRPTRNEIGGGDSVLSSAGIPYVLESDHKNTIIEGPPTHLTSASICPTKV